MHRPSRPGCAEAGVASCARSVTHLRDALPLGLVGSLAPAAEAAPWRACSRPDHYVRLVAQRVDSVSVTWEESGTQHAATIGPGFVLLVGAGTDDDEPNVR